MSVLSFLVLNDDQPAKRWSLRNAYLIGSDGNAIPGDLRFRDGVIECQKHDPGVAALALQVPAGDCGELTLQTCLLPDRKDPYLLHVELARHQLMMLYNKQEDWGMFDLDPEHKVTKRAALARRLFIEALCQLKDDPAEANRLAGDCLVAAIDGCEELALAHSELLLHRRKLNGNLPHYPIGCGINLDHKGDGLRAGLAANFDFLYLPISWRYLAPEEGEYRWQKMDNWIDWIARTRKPVVAGPIISFEPHMVPDWLYIWEHDFDTIRDLIYEHVERVVDRYAGVITAWNVVSGLHVNDHFAFSFDQVMDLTRMTTMLVKKTQETARTIIELRQPFGEYFSHNTRSVPPLMYADLLVQSAVNVDGFSIRMLMGQAQPGQYTRDLMQISAMLDMYAALAKPISLILAVPSDPAQRVEPVKGKSKSKKKRTDLNSGYWRKPWSPQVQSHWLEAILQIGLSKPFVDSVVWSELVDHDEIELPQGGLIGADLQPKAAFRRLATFRRSLLEAAAPDDSTAVVGGM